MNVAATAATAATDEDIRLPTRSEAMDAARKFESLFMGLVIRGMRQSAEAFGKGLFGESTGAQIKQGMFDSMLSQRVAASGRIGFAEAIVEDWASKGILQTEKDDAASS